MYMHVHVVCELGHTVPNLKVGSDSYRSVLIEMWRNYSEVDENMRSSS